MSLWFPAVPPWQSAREGGFTGPGVESPQKGGAMKAPGTPETGAGVGKHGYSVGTPQLQRTPKSCAEVPSDLGRVRQVALQCCRRGKEWEDGTEECGDDAPWGLRWRTKEWKAEACWALSVKAKIWLEGHSGSEGGFCMGWNLGFDCEWWGSLGILSWGVTEMSVYNHL